MVAVGTLLHRAPGPEPFGPGAAAKPGPQASGAALRAPEAGRTDSHQRQKAGSVPPGRTPPHRQPAAGLLPGVGDDRVHVAINDAPGLASVEVLADEHQAPYPPGTNGKAEQLRQTLCREWAYSMPFQHAGERSRWLSRYLSIYNRISSPSAHGDRSP